MADQDDFFTPDKIDEQIARVSQFQKGDRTDAEAIAYLRSFYQTEARQESLDRMWSRIQRVAPWQSEQQEQEKVLAMQDWQKGYNNPVQGRPPSRFRRRLGVLAAVIVAVALVGSLALVFAAVRGQNGGTASPHPTTPPTAAATPAATAPANAATAPFKVTSVDMSVSPQSIAGMACGTNVTVTYTALFHVAPNSAGGTVHFTYTINNGRGQTPATLFFNPGQTSRTYAFTWTGPLPADHTYPGQGGVQVTSPNQLTSQLVQPTGTCTSPGAAFQVTNVTMAVSPASIQGRTCGTPITVTYTATIYVAPNGPGGTVHFYYTVNNGRSQTPASVTFSPGQTSKTYSFTWSGTLPPDHTYPGLGGIQITSPNQLTSQTVKPSGTCS